SWLFVKHAYEWIGLAVPDRVKSEIKPRSLPTGLNSPMDVVKRRKETKFVSAQFDGGSKSGLASSGWHIGVDRFCDQSGQPIFYNVAEGSTFWGDGAVTLGELQGLVQ
ncbi:unnamed protein product, partial [Prorocentrum cordatum]